MVYSYLTYDQGFFFGAGGKGEKKKMPDIFTSRVICHPLIKVTINVCVIVYRVRFYRKFKRFATKAAIIERSIKNISGF